MSCLLKHNQRFILQFPCLQGRDTRKKILKFDRTGGLIGWQR